MFENLIHSLKRLFSVLADLFISINIHSFFYAFGAFESFEKSNGYTWPFIILIYISVRAISNLFLGVSLSQFIFGLRGNGDFLWMRLGGFLRSIYEVPSVLLFPLTESQIFFAKRTVKEYLSQTSINPKRRKISYFGILIYFPFTFCLAIFSPFYEIFFLQNPAYVPKLSNLTQKELKPDTFYEVPSVGLSTSSAMLNDRFVLIPSFKMVKYGIKNEYQPQYIVYDKILKRNLSFYFENGTEILSWIKFGKTLNPTFGILYPGLDSLNDPILSQQQSEEFELFLENSLIFDSSKPINYIRKNGMFIKGPLIVRSKILEKYPADWIEKIKLGNKTFLCIKETKNGKVFETFIPLYMKKGFVLRLSHLKDSGFRNDFLSTFFYFSNWGYPKIQSDFYLNKGKLDYKKFAAESLINSAKESLTLKDPLYQDTVLESLERFIFVSQLKGGVDFDIQSLTQFKLLKNALLEKSFALKGN